MRLAKLNLVLGLTLLTGCPSPRPTPSGGSGIPRKDLDVKNMTNLASIGQAYQVAQLTGSVKGAADLTAALDGHAELLKSARDKEPYEIVWRVDPGKIQAGASNVLLAWEKTAAPDGTRWVLYGNCSTVKKLSEDEFQKTPKAKPNS
jgi:hypothetical protein